jgi:hypothetical protein
MNVTGADHDTSARGRIMSYHIITILFLQQPRSHRTSGLKAELIVYILVSGRFSTNR